MGVKDKLIEQKTIGDVSQFEQGKDLIKGTALIPMNPALGLGAVKLRKKILEIAKKLKKAKSPQEELDLQKLLNELKSEQKLAQGDRGAAEQMPKKAADKNLRNATMRKMIEHLKEHGFKGDQGGGEGYGFPVGPGPVPMNRKKKGGKIKSKYSKGGGVRAAKYKI